MVRPRPSRRAIVSTITRGRYARTYLGGRSVINLGKVNPSLGLEVLWVVYSSAFGPKQSTKLTDLDRRVDSRVKVLQQASLPNRLIIDQDLESLIRVDDQSVQRSRLCDLGVRGLLEMLLLPFTSLWVSVSEDEMDFVGRSALVGTKHDCEWGLFVSWSTARRDVC